MAYTPDGIVHDVYVNMTTRPVPRPIRLVQYDDTLPILAVHLCDGDSLYTLPSDFLEANLRYKKPDGTVVYNPCLGEDADRQVLYFYITQQMTAADGKASATVEMVSYNTADDDYIYVYSSPIVFLIDRNPVQEDDIESSPEFETLLEYVDETKGAAEESARLANESEAWAHGDSFVDENGNTVDTSSDNSKYYKEQSGDAMHEADILTHGGTYTDSEGVTHTNVYDNAENYANEAEAWAHGGTYVNASGTTVNTTTDNASNYADTAEAWTHGGTYIDRNGIQVTNTYDNAENYANEAEAWTHGGTYKNASGQSQTNVYNNAENYANASSAYTYGGSYIGSDGTTQTVGSNNASNLADESEAWAHGGTFINSNNEEQDTSSDNSYYYSQQAGIILTQIQQIADSFVTWRSVDTLPATGQTGVIYLVPSDVPEQSNAKDEYVWILMADGITYDWEKIGSTSVSFKVDRMPSYNSEHFVKSGGVYDWFSGYPWTWSDLKYGRFNHSISSLTVVSLPDKTFYTVGETLNIEGLEIDGYNSTTQIFVDWTNKCTYTPAVGSVLTGSTNVVTATFNNGSEDLSVSFTIMVNETITVDTTGATVDYSVGDQFTNEGVIVQVHDYETGTSTTIDVDDCVFSIQNGDTITDQTSDTVTVTYGQLSTSYQINIVEEVLTEDSDNLNTENDENVLLE